MIAFNVGGCGKEDAKILFDKILNFCKSNAVFFTNFWQGYNILMMISILRKEKRKDIKTLLELQNTSIALQQIHSITYLTVPTKEIDSVFIFIFYKHLISS